MNVYLQSSANVVTVINKGEWRGVLIQGGRCEESRWLIRKSFTKEEQVSFRFIEQCFKLIRSLYVGVVD